MKNTGYMFVTAGFILASLVSVTDVLEVNWVYFLGSMMVCIIGIFLIKRIEKSATSNKEALSTNMKNIQENMTQIVSGVKKIRSEVNPQNPQEVHIKIDEILPQYLEEFVDARKTIGHVYGLTEYANIMNHFATGERYLNRVWSASTDGYIDEVTLYMEKCEEEFENALAALRALK
jgi:hypothetical protein